MAVRTSTPLYSAEETATKRLESDDLSGDTSIWFDETHSRVVHLQTGGFFAVDIAKNGLARDGLAINKLPVKRIDGVRFSPDESFFAFLVAGKGDLPKMGIANVLRSESPVTVPLHGERVLAFFWLPAIFVEFADLVVVTDCGIEVFRYNFDTSAVKSLKKFLVSAYACWYESSSGFIVCAVGTRTLQPYLLYCKTPCRLQKFDLTIPRNRSLTEDEIRILTIYEWTFCVHLDSSSGRVALRSLSGPSPADILLDVGVCSAPSSKLSLSVVDNLLLVHQHHSVGDRTFTFDLKQGRTLTPLVVPAPIVIGEDMDRLSLSFVSRDIVIVERSGIVSRLEVDLDFVTAEMHKRDKIATITFLMRRMACGARIIALLRSAIENRERIEDLSEYFGVINKRYRVAIESVSCEKRATSSNSREKSKTTVSIEALLQHMGNQTVLTEKNIVLELLYPQLLKEEGVSSSTPILQLAYESRFDDSVVGTLAAGEEDKRNATPASTEMIPFILRAALEYTRSLLSLHILPHRILQALVFELAVFFKQDSTLQQLLQYHILLDSTDIALRLLDLWKKTDYAWARLSCLDMSVRLRDWTCTVEVLLESKDYLSVIPFLRRNRASSYPIKSFLQRVAADVEVQTKDPMTLMHVIESVRAWRRDSKTQGSEVSAPNLRDCGRWIIDLQGSDEDLRSPHMEE